MNGALQFRLAAALDKWAADHEYRSDCQIIRNVAAHHGLTLSLPEAKLIWQHYSDCQEATWLDVDSYSAKKIFEVITSFVDRYAP